MRCPPQLLYCSLSFFSFLFFQNHLWRDSSQCWSQQEVIVKKTKSSKWKSWDLVNIYTSLLLWTTSTQTWNVVKFHDDWFCFAFWIPFSINNFPWWNPDVFRTENHIYNCVSYIIVVYTVWGLFNCVFSFNFYHWNEIKIVTPQEELFSSFTLFYIKLLWFCSFHFWTACFLLLYRFTLF